MKSDRIFQTAKKIEDFSFVKSGWHYGEGKTPKPEIITMALTLNDEFSKAGFAKTNAFLGLDGEIRVTACHDAIYFELTIEPNEQITFLLEKNDKEMSYEENISLDKALQKCFRNPAYFLEHRFQNTSGKVQIYSTNERIRRRLPLQPRRFISKRIERYF